MDFDEIEWHDGIYLGHSFSASSGNIVLDVEIYPEPINTALRTRIEVNCIGVKRFISTCDLAELLANKAAGNINHGYSSGDVFYIFLFGGFLEIQATRFEVHEN